MGRARLVCRLGGTRDCPSCKSSRVATAVSLPALLGNQNRVSGSVTGSSRPMRTYAVHNAHCAVPQRARFSAGIVQFARYRTDACSPAIQGVLWQQQLSTGFRHGRPCLLRRRNRRRRSHWTPPPRRLPPPRCLPRLLAPCPQLPHFRRRALVELLECPGGLHGVTPKTKHPKQKIQIHLLRFTPPVVPPKDHSRVIY
jgi:hypothetical protein